jgi:hypothetical protein
MIKDSQKTSNGKLLPVLIWAGLFAVAMAFVESAVVVYLRKITYPEGFSFPLKTIPLSVLLIELGREAATLLMLLSVAVLAVKRFQQRAALFAYLFGIWDIFYYIWLKLCIDWPSSLLEWDILFLIPLPWTAPVLAPVLVSLGFISGSLVILYSCQKGSPIDFNRQDVWIGVLVLGIILVSFLWNAGNVLRQQPLQAYRWELLAAGAALTGLRIFSRKRTRSGQKKE